MTAYLDEDGRRVEIRPCVWELDARTTEAFAQADLDAWAREKGWKAAEE